MKHQFSEGDILSARVGYRARQEYPITTRYVVEREGLIPEEIPGLYTPPLNFTVKKIIENNLLHKKCLADMCVDLDSLFDYV
jgi:hypothetical protein